MNWQMRKRRHRILERLAPKSLSQFSYSVMSGTQEFLAPKIRRSHSCWYCCLMKSSRFLRCVHFCHTAEWLIYAYMFSFSYSFPLWFIYVSRDFCPKESVVLPFKWTADSISLWSETLQIRTTMRFTHVHTHTHTPGWLIFSKSDQIQCWQGCGGRRTRSRHWDGSENWSNSLAVSPTSGHLHTLCSNDAILGLWGEMCVLMGSRRCTQHCQKKAEPGDHSHAHQQANDFINFHAREWSTVMEMKIQQM